MRTKLLMLLLAAVLLRAQTTTLINAGGQATGNYLADQGSTGGLPYGPANQSDPGWQAQTGIYQTLRYGPSFSYNFTEPNGTCAVKLDLMENRPAVATATVAAAGTGLRLFSVTANGVSTGPIDIFAAAGAQTPYSPPLLTVPVTNNSLNITFAASKGNAVTSGIEITCTPTPVVPPVSVNCLTPIVCAFDPASNTYTIQYQPPIPSTPTASIVPCSNCAGLIYGKVTNPDGSTYALVGVPVPAGFAPTIPAAP